VLIEGALAKTWEYKQNEAAAAQHYAIYRDGLKEMKRQDARNLDWVPSLHGRVGSSFPIVRQYSDATDGNFPTYGLGG